MKTLFIILPLVALVGCARFSTKQTEERYDNGQKTGEITTRVSATTFFEAKSALANFKASQTAATQSASVGALNQEASATNLTALLAVIVEAAVKAGAASVAPAP